MLKWCQKWDLNGKFFLIMFNIDDSFIFDLLIYYYLNLKSINVYTEISYHNNPNPNQISNIKDQNPKLKFFKFKCDSFSFRLLLNPSKKIHLLKCNIAEIIGYQPTTFYLSIHSKYLNESRALDDFYLDGKDIFINFRINGGSDTSEFSDNVLSTSNPLSLHRPFFLDSENSPNTWLLLLEFTFVSTRYSSATKAQYLTALLPTEILQSLGPKIIAIMGREKSDCDYFSEISSLVRNFYTPSQTELFDKYFRTQTLGLSTPSQFLSKACTDLERIHPGSSSNTEILRRFFLAALPPTARAILAGSEKSSLTDLADIADRVLLNLPNTTISNVEPSIICLIKDLADQVAALQLKFTTQRQSRPITDLRVLKIAKGQNL